MLNDISVFIWYHVWNIKLMKISRFKTKLKVYFTIAIKVYYKKNVDKSVLKIYVVIV